MYIVLMVVTGALTFLAGAGIAFAWANRSHGWVEQGGKVMRPERAYVNGLLVATFTIFAVLGWIGIAKIFG